VTQLIERAMAARGKACVSLTGGDTPRPLYERLADPSRPWRHRIDWARLHLYWGDERHVPPDHPDSNFGLANDALITHVPIPADHVHRMRGELPDAEQAAREYERGLPETFDIMLLGLGENAHIASLFPDGPGVVRFARAERGAPTPEPRVAATLVDQLGVWRITLTPGTILASRQIVMLVAGEKKAEAVEAAIERPLDVVRYPAQLLRDAGERVEWFIDRPAAARLRGVPPA
jgi:6-phosphogluconolactonase